MNTQVAFSTPNGITGQTEGLDGMLATRRCLDGQYNTKYKYTPRNTHHKTYTPPYSN